MLELRREDSSRSPVEHEGLEQEAKREELGGEKQEEASMARGEGAEGYQDGDGHFSQRVHELYQEFLKILQSNLEGDLRRVTRAPRRAVGSVDSQPKREAQRGPAARYSGSSCARLPNGARQQNGASASELPSVYKKGGGTRRL